MLKLDTLKTVDDRQVYSDNVLGYEGGAVTLTTQQAPGIIASSTPTGGPIHTRRGSMSALPNSSPCGTTVILPGIWLDRGRRST